MLRPADRRYTDGVTRWYFRRFGMREFRNITGGQAGAYSLCTQARRIRKKMRLQEKAGIAWQR